MTRNDGRISIKELPEEIRAALHKQKGVGWHPAGYTRGGHLADIPEPRITLSSIRGARRRVNVRVTRWSRHYFVNIDEEDEFYWHPTEQGWYSPWDLDENTGKGKSFSTRYTFERHVGPFIERTFEEHFPRRTHYMDLDRPAKRMWVYSRTGD